MLDKSKTDLELGLAVHQYLKTKGVETPFSNLIRTTANEEKVKTLEVLFTEVIRTVGLDLSDDSIMGTPKRMAKMYVNELFWGLDYENFPKITTVENKMQYDEMVIEKNIRVNSNCEHHFVTISGLATVAYMPDKKVLGLSKLNRIVEFFSKRPQIQERLTEQIYYALEYILETPNIAVMIDAEHFCVKSRGVEDINSSTVTSKVGGVFREDKNIKSELFNLLNQGKTCL